MARILDPSYVSTEDLPHEQVHAYVDPAGNLHDPDYRPFPAIIIREASTSKHHGMVLQSSWSDDEDDDEEEGASLSTAKRLQTKRQTVLNVKPTPRSSPVWYATDLPPLTSTSSHYTYTSSVSSALPSPLSVATPFEEEAPKPHRVLVRKSLLKAREESWLDDAEEEETPRHRRASEDIDDALAKEEKEHQRAFEETTPTEKQQEWTPTCADSFRRELMAVRMSINFKVYRLKKRIKRRLGVV